jgi:division protein CdvB (Snf7/Vps24/ESCRT-III family)
MIRNWDRNDKEPLFSRIEGKIRSSDKPMRDRIGAAVFRLKAQQNKLELANLRMQQRDKELFKKCIDSQIAKDTARASMYAEECAEIRKIAKVTLQCQLAIERASFRLEAVQEFGDIAMNMAPVANVIRSLKTQISGVMPEVSYELGLVGDTLNDIVAEAGEATGTLDRPEVTSQEAQKIMNEASAIAEQKMKEKFPELPASALAQADQERSSQSFM